jgi:hypothetical protein
MTRIIVVVVLTAAAAAQGFDPYKKQVVDYGVPKDFPGNPHHDQLTCFYYRGLMVKQLTNHWNKGALFLSFVLVNNEHSQIDHETAHNSARRHHL